MTDDDNDWDPAVESVLDYASRKARQHGDRPGQRNVSKGDRQQELSLLDCAWPPMSDSWYLQSLVSRLLDTVDPRDHLGALQALASFFEQEAERLHAVHPIDFHRSDTLH